MAKKLPIVFACDNNYLIYALSVILSLGDSNKPRFWRKKVQFPIYIFHEDITPENQELVHLYLKDFPNLQVEFINISQSFNFANFQLSFGIYPISTYFRMAIPLYFANHHPEYERVLYLDSDVAVTGRLDKLLDFDFQDKLIAGVREPITNSSAKMRAPVTKSVDDQGNSYHTSFSKEYIEEIVGIKYDDPTTTYINAGILLFNLKRFHQLKIEEEFFNAYKIINHPIFNDQDIINKFLNDRHELALLPYEYNANFVNVRNLVSNLFKLKKSEITTPEYRKIIIYLLKVLNPFANHRKIYHFIGYKKPWYRHIWGQGFFWRIAFKYNLEPLMYFQYNYDHSKKSWQWLQWRYNKPHQLLVKLGLRKHYYFKHHQEKENQQAKK